MTLERQKKAAAESGFLSEGSAEDVSPHFEVDDLCISGIEGSLTEPLSFMVRQKEIFGIFVAGPRKTALFQVLRGQGTLRSGMARLLGRNVPRSSAVPGSLLGVVPSQDHNTPGFDVTPREALNFHAELLGIPSGKYQDRISATLDMVRLSPYDHLKIAAFPGGMRRRLDLARGLLQNPEILLIDEPFAGVDEPDLLGLRQCLRRLRDEQGMTLILLIDQWKEGQELCDRVLILGACPPYLMARS